jgi:hypothetical protein
MTLIDAIWLTCFLGGLLITFCGVVYTNLSVQRMRNVLNSNQAPKDQLRWHDAIQKVAQNVINTYREAYPEGPLYRNLVSGYYIVGIGIVLTLGSAFAMKFTE